MIGGMNDSTDSQAAVRWWIVLAAAMWSTGGLFAKAPIFDTPEWTPDVRGLVLPFWRALFAGLILLPMVRRPQWHWLLVPMTLCYAAMNVTFLSAMSYTGAANVIWLQMTAPAWIFLLGRLWLKEKATRRDVVMFCFAVTGVATIVWFEFQQSHLRGVALGLASGLFYGGVVLFLRRLNTLDAAWLIFVNMAVTAAVTAPSALRPEVWPTFAQMATAAAFGIFQLGLPYVLLARGLRTVPPQEASGIGLIEPVLLPVWVYLAWGEPTSWWTMVGAGMILVGLGLRYMPRRASRA
jgi:DME family drug/metabolite transporter